jgi:hypothetical protein
LGVSAPSAAPAPATAPSPAAAAHASAATAHASAATAHASAAAAHASAATAHASAAAAPSSTAAHVGPLTCRGRRQGLEAPFPVRLDLVADTPVQTLVQGETPGDQNLHGFGTQGSSDHGPRSSIHHQGGCGDAGTGLLLGSAVLDDLMVEGLGVDNEKEGASAETGLGGPIQIRTRSRYGYLHSFASRCG